MLRLFTCVFGSLCFLKALDVASRGPEAIGLAASLAIAVPFAASAIAIARGRIKVASVVIILATAAVTVLSRLELYNQHLYLIASICLILLIGREVPVLLKAQLSIVYAFAALTKLNEAFLSGSVIYASAIHRPFWAEVVGQEPSPEFLVSVSALSIATEAFLAVAFWHPKGRWLALAVGVGFHTVMLVLMSVDIGSFLRLSVFGFLMMALYIPFFQMELEREVTPKMATREVESKDTVTSITASRGRRSSMNRSQSSRPEDRSARGGLVRVENSSGSGTGLSGWMYL